MTDIIDRLRDAPPHQTLCDVAKQLKRRCAEAADEIERLRTDLSILGSILNPLIAATGGLPPELVAKALGYVQAMMQSDERWYDVLTDDEFYALATATFEVPT